MKSWALVAVMVSAGAVAGCSSAKAPASSAGGAGTGGGGTTTTTTTGTGTGTGTGMGGMGQGGMGMGGQAQGGMAQGGQGGAAPGDCSQQPDFQSCYTCEAGKHPSGATTYGTLVECVICTACYTVIDGANAGCKAAPPQTDACDTGTPKDATAISTCQTCAQKGTCKPQTDACVADQDCMDFNTALKACPQN